MQTRGAPPSLVAPNSEAMVPFGLHMPFSGLNLQQVIYSSRPVAGLTLSEVDEIVESAQRYNEPRAITGRLLVATAPGDRVLAFMQWLEGPPLAIQACLKRIVKDPRHTSIRVVRDGPADERSYPEWSMRQEVLPAEHVEAALAAVGIAGHVDGDGIVIAQAPE